MTIKHVVFDVGQVLLNWDPEKSYEDLIPDADERRTFLQTVCTPQWNAEQDAGRSWREAEEILIARHPEKADLICAYRINWHKSIYSAREETVGLMQALIGRGVDVTLLTNFSAETWPEACAKYPFLTHPRGATVSGIVGMVKPDGGIYRHHSEIFGLDPAATFFTDDSAKNIDGARDFGWDAHHYLTDEGLRDALVERGLLSV